MNDIRKGRMALLGNIESVSHEAGDNQCGSVFFANNNWCKENDSDIFNSNWKWNVQSF